MENPVAIRFLLYNNNNNVPGAYNFDVSLHYHIIIVIILKQCSILYS